MWAVSVKLIVSENKPVIKCPLRSTIPGIILSLKSSSVGFQTSPLTYLGHFNLCGASKEFVEFMKEKSGPFHGSVIFVVKVRRHEGSCCIDMVQRHVGATKRCALHNDSTCFSVVWRGHVSGTKSQHVHTHEIVAGTCFKDILQRHVP